MDRKNMAVQHLWKAPKKKKVSNIQPVEVMRFYSFKTSLTGKNTTNRWQNAIQTSNYSGQQKPILFLSKNLFHLLLCSRFLSPITFDWWCAKDPNYTTLSPKALHCHYIYCTVAKAKSIDDLVVHGNSGTGKRGKRNWIWEESNFCLPASGAVSRTS